MKRPQTKTPLIIGIAGPSGAGKTVLAERVSELLGRTQVAMIQCDNYYKDRSGICPAERKKINYDHPDALDVSLLVDALKELKQGKSVNVPVYDFTTHRRKRKKITAGPADIIIVEGILILAIPVIRKMLDVKVFVDSDSDVRFIRRLQRDVVQRKRSIKSIIRQYASDVKPMCEKFVEPSKKHADILIADALNETAVKMLVTYCRASSCK